MSTLLGVSTRIWDLKPCFARACTRLGPFPARSAQLTLSWGCAWFSACLRTAVIVPVWLLMTPKGPQKRAGSTARAQAGAAGSGIITRRRVKKVRWSQEQTVPLSPVRVIHPLLHQPPACPATGTGSCECWHSTCAQPTPAPTRAYLCWDPRKHTEG